MTAALPGRFYRNLWRQEGASFHASTLSQEGASKLLPALSGLYCMLRRLKLRGAVDKWSVSSNSNSNIGFPANTSYVIVPLLDPLLNRQAKNVRSSSTSRLPATRNPGAKGGAIL
jgi:hypothetical protein